jgi:hypothetical protein
MATFLKISNKLTQAEKNYGIISPKIIKMKSNEVSRSVYQFI